MSASGRNKKENSHELDTSRYLHRHPAIDLLSVRLQDLGIRGCMVQDAEDFQEFLEQKDGKWDYPGGRSHGACQL